MRPLPLVILALFVLTAPAFGGFPSKDLLVPAAGRVSGAGGSQFYTDVWLRNAGDADATVTIRFLVTGQANPSPLSATRTIPRGGDLFLRNATEQLFNLSGALGALRVTSDQPVYVNARVFNRAPDATPAHTDGMAIAGVPADFGATTGERAFLQGVVSDGDFRYNIFVVESSGQPAAFTVRVRDQLGNVVAEVPFQFLGYQQGIIPISSVIGSHTLTGGSAELEVTAGAGRLIAIGSQIANGSQDATGFEMGFPRTAEATGVTSVNGLTGPVTIEGRSGVTISRSGGTLIIDAATAGTPQGAGQMSGAGVPLASAGVTLPRIGPGAGTAERGVSGNVGNAVHAINMSYGSAVRAEITTAASGARAVDVSNAGVGPAVYATSAGGMGVWGVAASISAAGLIGDNFPRGEAVVGRCCTGPDSADGIGAVVGRNDGPSGFGVRGFCTGTNCIGVMGQAGISGSTGNAGVFRNLNSSNTGTALVAITNSSGLAFSTTGNAVIGGNLNVTGTLSKGAGAFKIDHPLDPENKYLYHSFVESPDMMNIYNGVVVTDQNGHATVELPEWFSALNRDFRYQLTPIGGAAPDLHVAVEIENGRFEIAGAGANRKVSWQVTGIRQDAFANAHRIPTEEVKEPENRGRYLHARELGKSDRDAISYDPASVERGATALDIQSRLPSAQPAATSQRQ